MMRVPVTEKQRQSRVAKWAISTEKRKINVLKIDKTDEMIGCHMIGGIIERACVQPGKTFAEFKLVLVKGSEVVKYSVCAHTAPGRRFAAALDSWKSENKTAFEEKDLGMKATCAVHRGKKKKNPVTWFKPKYAWCPTSKLFWTSVKSPLGLRPALCK